VVISLVNLSRMFEGFPLLHGHYFTYQSFYCLDGICSGMVVAVLCYAVLRLDQWLTALSHEAINSVDQELIGTSTAPPDQGTGDNMESDLSWSSDDSSAALDRPLPRRGAERAGLAIAICLAATGTLLLIAAMLLMSATFIPFWIVCAVVPPAVLGLLQLVSLTSNAVVSASASAVRNGLPWYGAAAVSFACLQLPMWGVVPTMPGAVLAWLPWVAMRGLRLAGLCGGGEREPRISLQRLRTMRCHNCAQFLASATPGERRFYTQISGSLALALLGCGFVSYCTAATCLGLYSPDAAGFLHFSVILWSSRATRAWSTPPQSNHIYLTTAEDMATSVFVNAHTGLDSPDLVVLLCEGQPSSGWMGSGTCPSGIAANSIPMTRFDLDQGENLRSVHTALPSGLEPNTAYSFVITPSSDPEVRWFRTMGADGSTPSVVALGGDTGVNRWGEAVAARVAAHDVDLAMVGGDIAYTNGFAECYEMWDSWIGMWSRVMKGAGGRMIPLMQAVGNHDVGANALSGAWPSLSTHDDVSWRAGSINFLLYFPMHSSSTDAVPAPHERLPYHLHKGGNFALVVLDSGHYCRTPSTCLEEGDQVRWLDNSLAAVSDVAFKLACYHVPLYPIHGNWHGEPEQDGTFGKSTAGRLAFVPVFDKYHIQAGFENHWHNIKRTVPLIGGYPDPAGTVYFGDGNWGVAYDPSEAPGQAEEGVDIASAKLTPEDTEHKDMLVVSDVRYHAWIGRLHGMDSNWSATADNGDVLDSFRIHV
jgi:hypothetical protein